MNNSLSNSLAIVGISGRFPGAATCNAFMENLANAKESITIFTDDELREAGVDESLIRHRDYVKARGVLDKSDSFAAHFFDFSPYEAAHMDVQQRVFLECAWHALESANIDPSRTRMPVGIYASAGISTYLLHYLVNNPGLQNASDIFQMIVNNDKDFISTLTAYKCNLRGPAVTVQTACSSSLVAVHLACQALLEGETDVALAGGVNIDVPQRSGYLYRPGLILSPDGHCRPFDKNANGTLPGSGCGIVVLKRYADAIENNDYIYAVIRGTAINNDGADKVGFTAPSVTGQRSVLLEAFGIADINPRTIGYIETHGTGTELGDPIEIQALTQAFRHYTQDTHFCRIGSVKANIGHLNAAAGITGMIKTILSLQNKVFFPSVHFQEPNPVIDFNSSAVYVNTEYTPWESHTPRRAGVSSFGIGGTNAHVILEEAPPRPEKSSNDSAVHVLTISGKTDEEARAYALSIAKAVDSESDFSVDDIAFTLRHGRKQFPHRISVATRTKKECSDALRCAQPVKCFSAGNENEPVVVFLFPGQGSQYVCMGKELYEQEPVFRDAFDSCADIYMRAYSCDIREKVFPAEGISSSAEKELQQTSTAQPALFTTEYALAQLWLSKGMQPTAMIGHSTGEYVAACLAGVLSCEDALSLIAERGRLLESCAPGKMLAVHTEYEKIQPYLTNDIQIAAYNTPDLHVLSGCEAALQDVYDALKKDAVHASFLHTSHAFHSHLMNPVLDEFTQCIRAVTVNTQPRIPYVSSLTGKWITSENLSNPEYWAEHIRESVRFSTALETVWKESTPIFIEAGPGRTLSTFVHAHAQRPPLSAAIQSLPHPREKKSSTHMFYAAAGRVWQHGVHINLENPGENNSSYIPLPLYPFTREEYILDTPEKPATQLHEKQPLDQWLYHPVWRQNPTARLPANIPPPSQWLVLTHDTEDVFVTHLRQLGHTVIPVLPSHIKNTSAALSITLGEDDTYEHLFAKIDMGKPLYIIHALGIAPSHTDASHTLEYTITAGLLSLRALARVVFTKTSLPVRMCVLSSGAFTVNNNETLYPEKSIVIPAALSLAQEFPHLFCSVIDTDGSHIKIPEQILSVCNTSHGVFACRNRHIWQREYEHIPMPKNACKKTPVRKHGSYLITGGTGNIGILLAHGLAKRDAGHIALLTRSAFPAPSEWDSVEEDETISAAIKEKVAKLKSIRAEGTKVTVHTCNVADKSHVAELIQNIETTHGLHGVIHAAGYTHRDGIRSYTEIDMDMIDQHINAKVIGAQNLYDILHNKQLDFCVLMSSLSTVLGGLGFSVYAGSNEYMNTLVRKAYASDMQTPWIAMNWDGWNFTHQPRHMHEQCARVNTRSILPEEGEKLFFSLLSVPCLHEWVISTYSLRARIKQWVEKKDEAHKNKDIASHASYKKRPEIENAYTAPRNEIEEHIAGIFQECLGIEHVGIHDNFFELGGHSLLAVQVIARIRDSFDITLDLARVFENPTIAHVAHILADTIYEEEDDDVIQQMLEEIEAGKTDE